MGSSVSSEKTYAPGPAPTPPPNLPWKTKLVISVGAFFSDVARRPDGTINRRLASAVDIKSPADTSPTRGVSSHDHVLDPSRNLWIRLYRPADNPPSSSLPLIVFFHGGGFAFLSAAFRNYHAACRRFSRLTPAIVVSVNYRLAPEHRYPAPYEDGLDVLRFLDSGRFPSELPSFHRIADLGRCFVAGDSAGANIAHHVAGRWAAAAGSFSSLRVAGLIAIQPFFGGEGRVESELRLARAPLVKVERTDWLWRAFLPEGESRDHEAANVFGPRARGLDLGELFPPVMVVVGGFDPLRDWQWRYVDGLRERGRDVLVIDYPSAIHAFYLFTELSDAARLPPEIKKFVDWCSDGKRALKPVADVDQHGR